MPYDRQFAASPVGALQALERAVRQLEKFRSTIPHLGPSTSGPNQRLVLGVSLGDSGSAAGQGQPGNRQHRQCGERGRGNQRGEEDPPHLRCCRDADQVDCVSRRGRLPRPDGQCFTEPVAKARALGSPVLRALAEAEAAATTGDVVAEELSIARAQRAATSAWTFASRPFRWCEEEIHARVAAGRLRKGVELIGKVGADLLLMSDRVLQGGTVRIMDERVSASVEVGGQVLQSSRPTLTRMAMGSVLPGSALLVGLAVPKTATKDMRTASFILVHPEWRIVEPMDPDGAHR